MHTSLQGAAAGFNIGNRAKLSSTQAGLLGLLGCCLDSLYFRCQIPQPHSVLPLRQHALGLVVELKLCLAAKCLSLTASAEGIIFSFGLKWDFSSVPGAAKANHEIGRKVSYYTKQTIANWPDKFESRFRA